MLVALAAKGHTNVIWKADYENECPKEFRGATGKGKSWSVSPLK